MSGISGQEPPDGVLEAFGGSGPSERLAGGQGETFRAGRIVVKPATNAEEAGWTAGLFERLEGPGFRVPRPVRSRRDGFVVDGWCAWEFIEAALAGRNGGRWPETIAACRAFHVAIANEPRPSFLDRRGDAWAEADRLAFGERPIEPLPPFREPIARLTRLLRPVDAPSQLIHGDFTANVLFADGEPPCVIDFSPYWRPAAFALGVVIGDALSWTDADPSIIDLCADVPDAGALDTTTGFGSWTNLDTVTAGQGLALRYDPAAATFALAYGDGNDVKFRTSADGVTWSGATTIVTEASPIGSVALAFDTGGDACLFYTLATSTTLKRLRRTAGTWAGAGTAWSKTGSVASLTGLSAIWRDDYYLAVTGTEVTTTHERCWSVAMGDTSLPANAWSALVPIAEADAAASLTFHSPHLALVEGFAFATFQQVEAANVASSRVMLSTVNAAADPLATWREPYPLRFTTATAHGVALVYLQSLAILAALGANIALLGQRYNDNDISSRVLSCSWRETPTSLRLRLELDDQDGLALAQDNTAGTSAVQLGFDLAIQHGMYSDTGGLADPPELGSLLLANIARVTRRFESGKATAIVEADGPWEQMARFRAPQSWTAPSAATRGAIFQRIAGRAGLTVTEASGALTPSTAWSADTPAFAIAPGETAAQTLRRLLAPTPDFLRIAGDTGGFQVCGLAFEAAADAEATYGWPADTGQNPYAAFALVREHEPNWFRAQGPDRYADAFGFEPTHIANRDPYPTEPIFDLTRDISASSNALATAAAEEARSRSQHLALRAELTAPLQSAHELYDVVSIDFDFDTYDGQAFEEDYRIISRGVDFKRGPAQGAPLYNTILQLGRP